VNVAEALKLPPPPPLLLPLDDVVERGVRLYVVQFREMPGVGVVFEECEVDGRDNVAARIAILGKSSGVPASAQGMAQARLFSLLFFLLCLYQCRGLVLHVYVRCREDGGGFYMHLSRNQRLFFLSFFFRP